jgi:hypothetical protein
VRGGVEKYIPAFNGLGELRVCERNGVRTTNFGSFLGDKAQAKKQSRTTQPYRFGGNPHRSPLNHEKCIAIGFNALPSGFKICAIGVLR